ncbi:MAG: glutamine-synthetase adenylyltransferase, partial [Pseudomonadota bacterium]
ACYADLAQAVLAALYPVVAQHFALRHGPAPGAGGALVAMGSLGAVRLHSSSDLDLILVYDAAGQEASEGPKPMATRAYYARLTQALITALTAPMAQGRLYEVDMRLRPSGRNGPLATSLQSFDSYQQGEAWVWEHLALTRARPVAGAAVVGAAVEAVRQRVLAAPRNRADVGKEVADMRRRIIAARPGEGGLAAKDGPGRLQDLELFAQSLALLAGAAGRGVPDQLAQAAGAGYLTSKERDMLAAHDTRLWRLRAATRLILKPGQGADTAVAEAAGSTQVLLAGTGQESLEALSDEVAKASADVADLFDARLSAWQASV